MTTADNQNEITPEQGEKMLAEGYEALIAQIRTYRPDASFKRIGPAYQLAKEAHEGQTRKSGEPYMTHPLAVALILAELRSDMESIIAALLHDVIEDTQVTEAEIAEKFGPVVALLVVGVTKIEKHQFESKTDLQAENYRKMFFHISEDVRVILIKIADRLHNMRTIDAMRDEKRVTIARETLDIYAPLAHRLGIAKLRYELEDLGFKYSDRHLYNQLSKEVNRRTEERIALVEKMIEEIKAALAKQNIVGEVEGRPKRLYSVHKKMMSKGKTLDQIHDLYAVRILVDDVAGCYSALGCVNGLYPVVPGRIKDYIAGKKPNGYQSLHTTLIGHGEHFEVQIRSYEMHEVAEFGVAAHWRYKEGGQAAKDKWLQELMAWQQEISDSDEFLSALKLDLNAFSTHISVFTPSDEPKSLVKGSCPIDFAYAIHSAVGNRMVGARVNGRIVPIDHVLESGDIVEILTSQNAKPNKDWLNIVKTNQARTKITQWFNKENREDIIQRGKELLERAAEEKGVTLEELMAEGREADLLTRFNSKSMNQLYVMAASGGITEKQIINYMYREYAKIQPPPSNEEIIAELLAAGEKAGNRNGKGGVIVKGLGDTNVIYSKCCAPVPGDEILGFVTRGRGMTIHRTDCINIIHMGTEERRRILWDVVWDGANNHAKQSFLVNLSITCPDHNRVAINISETLGEEKITADTMTAKASKGTAYITIGINVRDSAHLAHVINRLQSILKADEIKRVYG